VRRPADSRSARRRRLVLAAVAAPVVAGTGAGHAASFPSKPVRVVVPFGPGGIADLCVRTIAPPMGEALGTQVVVENKPGAGGVVGTGQVAKAAPDGHMLLLTSNATAVSSALFRSLPYDPLRDLAPISTIGSFGLAIVVRADSRFSDLAALMRFVRERPGRLNVGTINIGSTQHLAAELFRARAAADFQIVPFNGTPAVLTALHGGHVDAAFEIVGPAIAQTGPGALRVLAVTSERRSPLLPAVPTVGETVLPGYEVSSWNALSAPAGTPPAVVARLNRAVADALATPEVAKRLRELGVEPRASGPQELDALLTRETRRWREVVERAGIERQ